MAGLPHPLATMLRVHLLQQHGSGERLKETSERIRSGLIGSLLGVAHNPVIKARLIKNFGHELVFTSRNMLRNTGQLFINYCFGKRRSGLMNILNRATLMNKAINRFVACADSLSGDHGGKPFLPAFAIGVDYESENASTGACQRRSLPEAKDQMPFGC